MRDLIFSSDIPMCVYNCNCTAMKCVQPSPDMRSVVLCASELGATASSVCRLDRRMPGNRMTSAIRTLAFSSCRLENEKRALLLHAHALHEIELLAMQAIVANAVRHTTTQATATAAVVTRQRPSRSAAVAARKLASAALNSRNNDGDGRDVEEGGSPSRSPELQLPGTRRARSPSSSLSPVPATPPPASRDAAVKDADCAEVVPAKRSASPGDGSAATADAGEAAEVKSAKKKRTRKPKEPEVYVIPDVERKETTFQSVPLPLLSFKGPMNHV